MSGEADARDSSLRADKLHVASSLVNGWAGGFEPTTSGPAQDGLAGRISILPKPFPKEFRRDVIAVARQGEQSIAQVARSFGISESCLSRWLKIADREDGISPDSAVTPSRAINSDLETENRELRKRTKQLEQENEILRRATAYFARDVLPK
jgi:transposase